MRSGFDAATLRGLAIQLAYSSATLAAAIDGHEETPATLSAVGQAYRLGRAECLTNTVAPHVFVSPELRQAWEEGQSARIDTIEAWGAYCKTLADAACRDAGGGGYEWYQVLFSLAVDRGLAAYVPESLRGVAQAAAISLGYLTPSEVQEMRNTLDANGYCRHGIEFGCCPAGCGEG